MKKQWITIIQVREDEGMNKHLQITFSDKSLAIFPKWKKQEWVRDFL